MNTHDLARQAGFITDFGCRETASDELLTRFAALVRAQTLEEAAGVCDNSASYCHDDGLLQVVLKSNAAAIRALKEQP